MTKKRKRDSSAVMPEAVVAQPEPVRVIHIVDMRSPTWRMLCGVDGDGPTDGSTLPELHARATCPDCLARLVVS